MARHAREAADERRRRLEENRLLLKDAIRGGACADAAQDAGSHQGLCLVLERFVVPQEQPGIIAYEGARGIERLLGALGDQGLAPVTCGGHLVGVAGSLEVGDGALDLRCTVRAGAQLALEVGPCDDLSVLPAAIAAFDRGLHVAASALGRPLRLLAQGYHPAAVSPSEVVTVPAPQVVAVGTHLARTGRLGRDALRCTAATRVRLAMPADPAEALLTYRIACALAPLTSFLCDNCLKVRERTPTDTPRMARTLTWERTDPARCGVVPGTFAEGFGPAAYELWLEGLSPIYFASEGGVCFSTGEEPLTRLLEERTLTASEARELLGHVRPWARWDGALDLMAADSLPPRQAVGYAALVKGLLASPGGRSEAAKLLGIDERRDEDVTSAFAELRAHGWDARVYGRRVTQLAHELAGIAARGLASREERSLLEGLAQLWDVAMVPRDALVMGWEHSRPRSRAEEAARLWGEGAVIPYEELQGEPPAGSTAVMRLEQLRGGT